MTFTDKKMVQTLATTALLEAVFAEEDVARERHLTQWEEFCNALQQMETHEHMEPDVDVTGQVEVELLAAFETYGALDEKDLPACPDDIATGDAMHELTQLVKDVRHERV